MVSLFVAIACIHLHLQYLAFQLCDSESKLILVVYHLDQLLTHQDLLRIQFFNLTRCQLQRQGQRVEIHLLIGLV